MTETIRTVLIDDEPKALEVLDFFLNQTRQVAVADKIQNPDRALSSIIRHKPDLIFLDICMPEKDGFQIVDEIRQIDFRPGIIFTTAHERYAVKAIKYSAFDYLLKPIDFVELINAIEKFKQVEKNPTSSDFKNLLEEGAKKDKIKFKTREGIIFLTLEDIYYLEADSNYTVITLQDKERYIVSTTLGEIEKKLPPEIFYRISRSVIINTNYLTRIDKKTKKCVLHNQEYHISLKISKGRIHTLENLFP